MSQNDSTVVLSDLLDPFTPIETNQERLQSNCQFLQTYALGLTKLVEDMAEFRTDKIRDTIDELLARGCIKPSWAGYRSFSAIDPTVTALLKSLLESRKTTDMRKEQELLQKALDAGMVDPSLREYLSCSEVPRVDQQTQTEPDLLRRNQVRKTLTSGNVSSTQAAVTHGEQSARTPSYAPRPTAISQLLIVNGEQSAPIAAFPSAGLSITIKPLRERAAMSSQERAAMSSRERATMSSRETMTESWVRSLEDVDAQAQTSARGRTPLVPSNLASGGTRMTDADDRLRRNTSMSEVDRSRRGFIIPETARFRGPMDTSLAAASRLQASVSDANRSGPSANTSDDRGPRRGDPRPASERMPHQGTSQRHPDRRIIGISDSRGPLRRDPYSIVPDESLAASGASIHRGSSKMQIIEASKMQILEASNDDVQRDDSASTVYYAPALHGDDDRLMQDDDDCQPRQSSPLPRSRISRASVELGDSYEGRRPKRLQEEEMQDGRKRVRTSSKDDGQHRDRTSGRPAIAASSRHDTPRGSSSVITAGVQNSSTAVADDLQSERSSEWFFRRPTTPASVPRKREEPRQQSTRSETLSQVKSQDLDRPGRSSASRRDYVSESPPQVGVPRRREEPRQQNIRSERLSQVESEDLGRLGRSSMSRRGPVAESRRLLPEREESEQSRRSPEEAGGRQSLKLRNDQSRYHDDGGRYDAGSHDDDGQHVGDGDSDNDDDADNHNDDDIVFIGRRTLSPLPPSPEHKRRGRPPGSKNNQRPRKRVSKDDPSDSAYQPAATDRKKLRPRLPAPEAALSPKTYRKPNADKDGRDYVLWISNKPVDSTSLAPEVRREVEELLRKLDGRVEYGNNRTWLRNTGWNTRCAYSHWFGTKENRSWSYGLQYACDSCVEARRYCLRVDPIEAKEQYVAPKLLPLPERRRRPGVQLRDMAFWKRALTVRPEATEAKPER